MKLVINADDFGYTRGNTEGILEGYRKGIVRSTTALCNMPWLEYGRDLAKDCPGLGIGVHLTLTLGRSLTGVKSFTDAQGNFLSKKDIGSAVLDMEEVYDEWKAQIERYIQVFGHRPTHLDSHHHVHTLNENNKKVAMRLGEEYGLFVRCCGPYEFVSGFYGPSATEEHLLEIWKNIRETILRSWFIRDSATWSFTGSAPTTPTEFRNYPYSVPGKSWNMWRKIRFS